MPNNPSGKPASPEHRFDGQRAARHVARVLQDAAVARHQGRCGKAEHLPERKVPRHHGEHHAERIEGDERFCALDLDGLSREIACGVVREMVAGAGALVDLGTAVGEGLAHLARHKLGELVAPRAQHVAGRPHEASPRVEVGASPGPLRIGRTRDRAQCIVNAVRGVGRARQKGPRVDGDKVRKAVGAVHRLSPELRVAGLDTTCIDASCLRVLGKVASWSVRAPTLFRTSDRREPFPSR